MVTPVRVLELSHSPTLHDPAACSPPGSSIPGIFQARALEWVAVSSSRGPFPPRLKLWDGSEITTKENRDAHAPLRKVGTGPFCFQPRSLSDSDPDRCSRTIGVQYHRYKPGFGADFLDCNPRSWLTALGQYFVSSRFSFLVCKLKIIIVLTSRGSCERR